MEQSWNQYGEDGEKKKVAEVPDTLNVSYDFERREFVVPVQDLSTVFQYCLGNLTKKDARLESIQSFLGSEDFDSHHKDFVQNEIAANIKCFHDVVARDFDIKRTTNFNRTMEGSDKEVAPKYREFEVGPNNKESLLCEGFIFAQHKQFGNLVVFELEAYLDGGDGYLEVRTHYIREDSIVRSFWDAVKEYFCTSGPLKGQTINNKWEYITPTQSSLNDVVLSEAARSKINRNVLSFLNNSDLFASKGLSKSRGILLYGAPGTGKTMTCESIINQVDCTVICVSNDTVENLREIKSIYSLAEKLAPTLMVIEDIDTLGGLDRREGGSHPLLGELLASLNGLGPSGNVVTVATTNYPQYLDRALADRPGRFDIRIEFPIPDAGLRQAILEKYLAKFKTDKISLEIFAKETKGLTGAYIREVVTTAYLITIERDLDKITSNVLRESLTQVKEMKQLALKEIGVTSAPTEDMFS
jgi:AAA+ superfamily predicted ATPase